VTGPRAAVQALSALALVTATMAATSAPPSVRSAGRSVVVRPARGPSESEAQQARERWWHRQRAYPYGRIPPRALLRARAQAARLPLATSAAGVKAAIVWSPLGPRPIDGGLRDVNANRADMGAPPWSGRVTAIADAADEGKVYLGAAGGGVWVSDDMGGSWAPLFDEQPSLSLGALATDPNDERTIYAGTGEAHGSLDSYYGAGMLKSGDGGQTWRKVDEPRFDDCFISDIEVDPSDSNIVVAAVSSHGGIVGRTSCASRDGIYLSVNGGTSWSRRLAGAASDLSVEPGGTNWFAGIRGSGVWNSTDSGASWTHLTHNLPTRDVGRVAVARSESNPNRVYAAIESQHNRTLLGLFTSANGGGTWTQINAPPDVCGTSCFYSLTLAVDPSNDGVLYFGGTHLYRFDNFGANPHRLGSGPNGIHVDVHALTFSGGQLWVGDDGGVARTADGGATFINATGDLQITQFYPGISATPGARTVIGGNQDDGTVKFTGTRSWVAILTSDGGPSAIDPRNPRVIFASFLHAQVAKSTNGGQTFSLSFGPNQAASAFAPLLMDPSSPRRLYVGTDAVFQTTTGGDSPAEWKRISPHFPNAITAMGVSNRRGTRTTYAGTENGQLEVREGAGRWHDTGSNGLPNRTVTDIVVNPARPAQAFVSLSGFGPGHVFRTRDAGGRWTNVSGGTARTGLPNSPANTLAVDPRRSPPQLYVGTDVGVFTSADGGASWRRYGRDLPNAVVMDLLIDLPSNRLLAATHGRGMFAAQLIHARPDLRADYRLQNSLASSTGSPPNLKRLGPGTSHFTSDTVAGHSRRVFAFPKGNGLALSPTTRVAHPSAYTIVVLARLDDTSGFERLIDFSGGASDRGLYSVNGRLTFWPRDRGSIAPIHEGEYVQIVLTRDVDDTVAGYVNGKPQFTFTDSRGDAILSKASVRFFVDDRESPGEHAKGRVARIRVWRGALTARQVANLDDV
jgi:concanavalin A-like lectin/glucanase superfamily protein